MAFNKVESGISKGLPADVQQSSVHKCVPWCRRIFYFGTKPVSNPSRNCTNNECFQGGYAAVYQIPGWNYFPFGQILDYNYAQDHIFPIKDHMFMLLYSRFDGFYFYGLHEWKDQDGGWKEANVYRTGESSMARDMDCSVLTCNSCDQETAYLVILGEKNGVLKIFELKKNVTYANFIDLNIICTIENALGYTPCCLLQACVKDKKLYALCGKREGCHTTWDSCKILTVCLESKTPKVEDCQGDSGIFPPFVNGPQCAVHDGDKWVMVGGVDSAGTTSRDIWVLNLDSFQWRRSGEQVPSDLNMQETCATHLDSILFVADKQNAIYNFPIANL